MPELCDITNALVDLQGEFFELGIQLKLQHKQLKAIENDHKGNQSRCLIETIVLWQQNDTTGECSWSTLAEAVKNVGGHEKLVSELKKRDMTDSNPKALHYPPEPTERANEGCASVSDSTRQRYDSKTRPSESEDESGYSSKNDSVQSGDSSGSEIECFEQAPGCGCTDKKPCSVYALCAGGCPNPTRKRVPVLIKKSNADAISSQNEIPFEVKYDFEDYEKRTKEMQKSYGSFAYETLRQFKISNLNIRELTIYIQGAYPVMKPRMEELSKAIHFEDFFMIIMDQGCSWFDYEIIKDLILLFCTSAKSCLDEYEVCFKMYAEQRLPNGMKHIKIGSGARKGGKHLVIKIDREWEKVTFSDLDKVRGAFASILDVRRSDLYLADIREGCIMMTFMITEELAGRLFPSRTCLTSTQVQSLKDEGVLSVKCGSFNWQAAASNSNSHTPSPETRFDCNKQNPDSTKQIVDHLQYKLPQERKKLPILPKTDGNAKYDIHDQNAEDNLYADHSKQINKFSEIVYALTPLADKYFELGMQLELDYEQLKAIENDNHGNQSLCLHDTIYLWQQNNTTGECSWSTLAEAVNRVGGHDKLVSELKKRDMAGSKPQAPHHPPETERANEGYISVSDSALQRCDSRPSESEDESGCSSKSDSVQSGDSSESEAEFFELAPGCGCTGEKPCSLYTLCAGGCPNPTKMRVSVLRKKSKAGAMSSQNGIPFEEECDFENYEERTKAIHKSFGIFLCETSHYFETSKVDIQKLTLYVQGTYPVMKPRMEELSKVTHFADFFRIIVDQACSWFDYGIIKDLILLFCTSAKSCLDQYETCFKKYAEQRLPKGMKHIEIGGGAKKGGKQLVIKIDREWEEVTFSDPNKLQGTFASILGPGVRRSDLYLADIREGCSCIMMTFMITEELAGRLFPSKTCLTSSQVKSLKDEGVLSVKCGNLSWRAAASNNERDRARPETRVRVVCKISIYIHISYCLSN